MLSGLALKVCFHLNLGLYANYLHASEPVKQCGRGDEEEMKKLESSSCCEAV
jgi:hypothetical protein